MTTQPIRNKAHIKQISSYFLNKGELRNYLLFIMGIHTALRISDMLRLTCNDVYDFTNNRVRREFSIVEKKTGKSKIIAVNRSVVEAISKLFNQINPLPNDFLFAHPTLNKAISRIQAYRILRAAAEETCVDVPISCHSLRKTFGYHLWKKGTSLVIIMDIYNHSSYAVTKRYLGITQDDKNSAYLKLQFST
jgi:integrase